MVRKKSPEEQWEKMHVKRYTFAVMKGAESDIYDRLESVPSRAAYIKSLIRADIDKSK